MLCKEHDSHDNQDPDNCARLSQIPRMHMHARMYRKGSVCLCVSATGSLDEKTKKYFRNQLYV